MRELLEKLFKEKTKIYIWVKPYQGFLQHSGWYGGAYYGRIVELYEDCVVIYIRRLSQRMVIPFSQIQRIILNKEVNDE